MTLEYTETELNETAEFVNDRALMHIYIAEGDEAAVSLSAGTWTKYPIKVTPTIVNKFTPVDIGLPTSKIVYNGTDTVYMSFQVSSSLTATTNNAEIDLILYKNGVAVPWATIERKIQTAGDVGAFSIDTLVPFSQDDTIELYVKSSLATSLTLSKFNAIVKEENR